MQADYTAQVDMLPNMDDCAPSNSCL